MGATIGLLFVLAVGWLQGQPKPPVPRFDVVETVLGPAPGLDSTLIVSPDGSRIGIRTISFEVFVDQMETPLPAAGHAPVFSADSKRIAYAARKGNTWVILADGVEGPPFNRVWAPVFSADGKRLAHAAERNKKELVVADRVEGKEYDVVDGLRFSPDGTRVAYAARRGAKWVMVVNGAESKEYDRVGVPVFGSGGKLAWQAKRDKTQLVVVDDSEGPAYDWVSTPRFSPDGKRMVYAASRGGRVVSMDEALMRYDSRGATYFVVVDGIEGPAYEAPPARLDLGFSPDSTHLAFRLHRGKGMVAVIDGAEKLESLAIGDIVFSPDGKRMAHAMAKERSRVAVWVDGQAGAEYEGVSRPVFSPDSRRLAYMASRKGSRFLVVDGQEVLAADNYTRFWGPSSEIVESGLDWREWLYLRTNPELHFAGPSTIVTFGVNMKKEMKRPQISRVRVEIGDPLASGAR